jgi:hypothetical protein
MGSANDFTTDISEWIHIHNVKEWYWLTNNINYIRQMLKHNNWCTGHDSMAETLSQHALQGWYDIACANGFNPLAPTNIWWNACSAHRIRIQHIKQSHFSAPYHTRYTIWEKHMSTEYTEVSQ